MGRSLSIIHACLGWLLIAAGAAPVCLAARATLSENSHSFASAYGDSSPLMTMHTLSTITNLAVIGGALLIAGAIFAAGSLRGDDARWGTAIAIAGLVVSAASAIFGPGVISLAVG